MDCHRLSRNWCRLLLFGGVLLHIADVVRGTENDTVPSVPSTAPASPDAAKPTPITIAFRNDAAINDVAFVDPSTGWAVGDRGVIWHTTDGGTTWRQQSSPVSCRLSSACFIDAHRGWAVGGECRPYGEATLGVVLRTDDGGATWISVSHSILPLLCGVKFFDRVRGIAFGQSASFSPSGLFVTRDGGESWQPLPTDRTGNWLAGDFLDPESGALGGPAGEIATLARQEVVHSPLATSSLRSFRAMRLTAPTGGWAAGDGGLLMITSDLGRSWQSPPASLPEPAPDHFDFRAVAVHRQQVWVAGLPGSRIFHSADGGQSWQSVVTGITAPLRAITFVDAQHGWAAGDLGNILATRDGGQSWQVQRSGGRRAALLAILANPDDVPLELLADSGAAEGYLSAVDILCSVMDAPDATRRCMVHERWQEALLLSGATSSNIAWRFPLPSAELDFEPKELLDVLNRENDGRAIQQMQNYLVRELRMWQPDVVVTYHAVSQTMGGWGRGEAEPSESRSTEGSPTLDPSHPLPMDKSTREPLAALIEQLVAKSVDAAAAADGHDEVATQIGLPPWRVKKVYGVLPPGSRGDEMLAAGRFSPWLGLTLNDFVSPARTLFRGTASARPDTYELKLLATHMADPSPTRGLFGGISLAPGSEARRLPPELPVEDLDKLRQMAARRRHLQALMRRNKGDAAWAAQVTSMIDGLGADDGGHLLVQLAAGYRDSDRLDLAADTYFLFARRYPDHPLVDQALVWLEHFYASAELAHRLTIHTPPKFQSIGEPPSGDVTSGEPASSGGVQQASAVAPLGPDSRPVSALSRDDRLRRAVQLADYLKTARPALYAEPAVRFAEVTAQRELGYENPAKRFFLTLSQFPGKDAWRACAESEAWLANPGDAPPPKKLATCRPTEQPPKLDGQLDEPFWNTADRLRLADANAGRTTLSVRANKIADKTVRPAGSGEIRLAYDHKFLYVAVRCPKASVGDYGIDDQPRPRDADLRGHDRVTLSLDVDRDFTTAFELTIDNRGWTHDICWGDPNWNPSWYVAAATDDSTWTVEAAVPFAELISKPPESRHVWAVAARRTIPRVGYESWAGAATSDDSPDKFGLLIFE
jgi:photosystem II stability/assembly factor-like uncharacterized protein